MRICVIGAGAAGLCCAYHLLQSNIDHVVFEQTSCVGGTWVYTEETNVHSSMYRDLRTNLPIEIMGYPGFVFPPCEKSFAHHSVVQQYLQVFFEQQVMPGKSISFNSTVTNVYKESANWSVDVTVNGEPKTETFTHIIVCTGKYTVPRLPSIQGADTFDGDVIHSHNYRTADAYAGKRVLIIGAGFSGVDIAIEVSRVAKSCFLSHRSHDLLPLTSNVIQKRQVVAISGKKVFFESDFVEVDCIIYCTGYMISFPFLNDLIKVKQGYEVCDLYRHCLSIEHPSLCFIGLPSRIVPCTVFDYQIRWVIGVFSGRFSLPSDSKMREACNEERLIRTRTGFGDLEFSHDFRNNLWDYLESFVADGLGVVDPAVRRGYEAAHNARKKNLVGYRGGKLEF